MSITPESLPPLPPETAERRPPLNLEPADAGLFLHEYRKSFGPTLPRRGAWDFSSEGLLLVPRSGRVDGLSFQGGFPPGLSGLKVRAKGVRARWAHPRVEAVAAEGTTSLVITDEFSNGYFHWVADALPKLWWARRLLTDATLILPAFARRYRYMAESLAPWPELRTLVVKGRTRTALNEALVLPSLAPTGNYRPALMAGLADAWRRHIGPAQPHRQVYVSRARAPWRKIGNEEAVWAVLKARGFERVLLEELSFADQVKLLAETRFLVGNHGAGLTNLMFMVPGTRVLEIRLRGDAANNCYFSLASAVGVDYAYLLADPVPGQSDSHKADLIVDPVALGRTLEALG